MNRRRFLQLLGLSGAAVATGGISHLFSGPRTLLTTDRVKKLGFMTSLGRSFIVDAVENHALWPYLDRTAVTAFKNGSLESRHQLEGLRPLGPWRWYVSPEIRKLKDTKGHFLWQPGLGVGEPDLFLGRPITLDRYVRGSHRSELSENPDTELFNFYAVQEWGV